MKYHKDKPFNDLPDLPPKANLETSEIFKLTIRANKLLAELKGYCQTLPNPNLLLNTIILQESKESNAIENIVTTQDELYKATLNAEIAVSNASAKEVLLYREAMYWGLSQLNEKKVITTNMLVGIMQKIKSTTEEVRKNSGTKLANPINQNIVYTPPEGEDLIRKKLQELEVFINNDAYSDLDPLIKMALIHYQYEAIHPFSDGNGRTGRILNVLYLIQKQLIGLPVLYLSYYIIQNKADYYRLLREVTEEQNWQEWVKYILKGVADTAEMTLNKIKALLELKSAAESLIKDVLKTSYSRDLVDLLFSYPYIKIKVLEEHNIAKRQTAGDYLKRLESAGILTSVRIGKETYFINHELMKILSK